MLDLTRFRHAALFLDFENVFYTLINDPLRRFNNDAALSATMDVLNRLREQMRDDGYVLIVERSYADWERMPINAQRQLQVAGVLPRFADSRADKNTADIELSLDILECILSREALSHIVLIGGDRDYLPILRRVKEQRRSIQICSLRRALSGDVRAFASNYAQTQIIELDELIEWPEAPPEFVVEEGDDPEAFREETARLYLQQMLRFMAAKSFSEIHLGPFFRWLQDERVFEHLSVAEQRKTFDHLKSVGAVSVLERDTGQGYTFSIAHVNTEHALSKAAAAALTDAS